MLKRIITFCLIGVLLLGTLPVRAQDDVPVTHVVQPGENLYRIALSYGVTLDALMAANGLTVPDLVLVGQTLIIPGGAAATSPSLRSTSPAAATDSARTHTVQVGEGLLHIARQYGITLDELLAANAIVNPSLIVVGQVLVIPGAPDAGASDSAASAVEFDPVDLSDNQPDSAREVSPSAATAGIPATSNALDPATPDLGILPVAPESEIGDAAGEGLTGSEVERSEGEVAASVARDSTLTTPDLGIISTSGAAWTVAPGILSLGDAANLRAIYERGQALGNNPRAFSTVGDCNSEPPFFLAKFDKGEYNLGDYAYLQPVIDQFAGSFNRDSAAVWTGNHAWALFDPVWANPLLCEPGEMPLACEYRIQQPSLALIRLGTNEAGSTALFEENLRRIIEFSITRGVIPVLGTKADRLEGSDAHNALIRRLAAEYGVPLWDFGQVADTLPGRGLMPDGFHMTYIPPDYTAPLALQTGHSVQNLLALMALNTVWRNVMD
ncbi:MAG: LysM peptidoglycan-binding domain-containing protein [Anaerolineae bacterium]|nr:LysM peptidoglycan-binding domain-containing protein [Anaerolineae bacterium]